MSDWTIESVLEDWISDRTKPSRRKLAFLKQMHDINVKSGGEPHICPSHISSELDLPNGSSWPDVIADFLDFIESQKVGHTVVKHKFELGNSTFPDHPHTAEPNMAQSKIINELNVLSDFIANEEISESRKDFLLGKHDETLGNMEYVMVHGSKWRTETYCPDGIIEGLNNLAKTTEYPLKLDVLYPYWEYAIAFALDLINWIEKDEILESELSEKIDQINYQMNYFCQEFEFVI